MTWVRIPLQHRVVGKNRIKIILAAPPVAKNRGNKCEDLEKIPTLDVGLCQRSFFSEWNGTKLKDCKVVLALARNLRPVELRMVQHDVKQV